MPKDGWLNQEKCYCYLTYQGSVVMHFVSLEPVEYTCIPVQSLKVVVFSVYSHLEHFQVANLTV